MSFLARRVDRITEMVRAEHPDARDIAFLAIKCDECGRECVASNVQALDKMLRREGWLVGRSARDLCPDCRP